MLALTFPYKRHSDLPHRDFVVTVQRCPDGAACGSEDSRYETVAVEAPDSVAAVELVARHVRDSLLPDWHWHRTPGMVRVVDYDWGGYGYTAPVVKVCEAY